jgi:acyl-coenzyme A thioesterase PaaI-like protein
VTTVYPPAHHIMRDVAPVTELRAVDHSLTVAPLTDQVRNAAGHAGLGVLAMLCDVTSALVALPAGAPDWTATADLSLHAVEPLDVGPIIVEGRLVRAGQNIVVVGVEVYDGLGGEALDDARHAAAGLVALARIPRQASLATADPRSRLGQRIALGDGAPGLSMPVLDQIGLRVVDATGGVVELEKTDYVRNSFGTINGGVLGMVFQGAAEAAVQARGHPFVATDVLIHYLAQTKAGPARTATRVLRLAADHAVCHVRAVDAGNDDLLLAVATVTLQRW